MKRLFTYLAVATAALWASAADPIALHWDIVGVEATQSKVVLADYPVKTSDTSAGGLWVLNSTEPSYAKTTTTWVTTANAKTLQLGASATSAVGTILSLSATANPIPAGSTINTVEITLKSVLTESTWSVAIGGSKYSSTMIAPSATAMADCSVISFYPEMAGNTVALTFEGMETAGKYVYIAAVDIVYTPGSGEVQKTATPTFSPESGATVASGCDVSITSATPGAKIFCAIGSEAFSEVAGGRLTISGAPKSTVSVRAYASSDGMTDSDIATATYTFAVPPTMPPYDESFDNSSSFGLFTVIDSNKDGSTWKYYSTTEAAYIEHSLGNGAKNDWLITRPLMLEAGAVYTLRFDAKAGNATYPEAIAVALGSSPTADSMTETLLERTDIDHSEYKTYEATLRPAATGTYYIGFHAVSDAGMYRLFLDNIAVSAPFTSTAPAAVDNIKIVNDYDGRNQAEISFRAPSTSFDGTDLSGKLAVAVTRGRDVVKTFENVAPGQDCSFVDGVEAPAVYTYTFVASNEAGEGNIATKAAYIGIAAPMPVTRVEIAENPEGTALLSWEAPNTTVNGDRINPALITYNIYGPDRKAVAEGVTECTFSHQPTADGSQTLAAYTVYSVTAAGPAAEGAVSVSLPVGTPYPLPYYESFEHWTASTVADFYEPAESSGTWRIMRQMLECEYTSYDGDDGMLVFDPKTAGDVASYATGKIAVPADAVNPVLTFQMHGDTSAKHLLTLTVEADGDSHAETFTPDAAGWQEKLMSLSDYKGRTVRIRFTATAATPSATLAIDMIQLRDIPAVDLALTRFRMPLEMDILKEHTASVTVGNVGLNPVNAFRIELLADGNIIGTRTLGSIDRGQSKTADFAITPTVANSATYSARIALESDLDQTNNFSADIAVEHIHPIYAPVKDLATTADGSSIKLSWTAPEASDNDRSVTETFERYNEFGIDKAGDWTFADIDGAPTYGINDGHHSFPNMASPMAYIVFNGTIPTVEPIGSMTFGAHSGNQYLASFSISDGETANNDWLISPRLNGAAQTITFYARSMSIGTRETFEMLYSTTGTSTSAFIKVAGDENSTGTWTQYSFDVPEGARYFAIRCTSKDQYALFIDDISYIPAPSELDAIAGYDIYRNGDKLNETPVSATEYTDTDVPSGTHSYEVMAVMPRGYSEARQTTVACSGIEGTPVQSAGITVEGRTITAAATEATHMAIYSIAGSCIVSDRTNELKATVNPGIYIVEISGRTSKIAVR